MSPELKAKVVEAEKRIDYIFRNYDPRSETMAMQSQLYQMLHDTLSACCLLTRKEAFGEAAAYMRKHGEYLKAEAIQQKGETPDESRDG